jgi:flagellar hook protein FlgE
MGKGANMSGISSVASSALQAFSTSQQITANNVANVNTDGFKASRTTFQENRSGGVTASVSSTGDSVDISREAVNLISNTQGFKANLNVLKATDEMTKELLNIKA